MSIEVDGHEIDTCGNTVIFSDSRLKPLDMKIPEEIATKEYSENAILQASNRNLIDDYWSLKAWWITANEKHYDVKPKIVIIRGQNGTPIAMYSGKKVSWEVSEDLPKTTLLKIDGKALYIHRAEFSIIDSSLFK